MVDEVIDKAVVAELGTTDLHIKAEQLFARVGAAAEAIDALIAHNARVAQDQGEYQRSFDKLNTEYARLLADYDKLLTQINDLKNREAAYRYYKKELATLDPASIEFTPYLWHTLVNHAGVSVDGTITRSGTEDRRRYRSRSDRLIDNCDIVYRVLGTGVHGDFVVVRVFNVQRREWNLTDSNKNETVCKEI